MTPLCIDARWLHTGIGAYTLNLVREISHSGEFDLHLLAYRDNRAKLQPYARSITIVDAPIYSVREQCSVASAARPYSLLHVPHYTAPLPRRRTLLVTIHDLTHILDARLRTSWQSRLYARPMLHLVSAKADHIFTVSDYCKRQIMEHLGVRPEKVTVTYNGVGREFYREADDVARATVARECGVECPFVLYVGNLKRHKNVDGLLRAFAQLNQRNSGAWQLVVVGDPTGEGAALRELAGRLGITGAVCFAGRVPERVLRAAYSCAELTVLPSIEEGFGLPVVEAMACGSPVACSQSASLPEVGGDAAEYFDPHDTDSIAAAMELILLKSSAERNEVQRKGFEQARRFTWSDCANRHREVYRRYAAEQS